MKIIIEGTNSEDSRKVISEVENDDLDCSQVLDLFFALLVAYGFNQKSIEKCVIDFGQSYDNEEKE